MRQARGKRLTFNQLHHDGIFFEPLTGCEDVLRRWLRLSDTLAVHATELAGTVQGTTFRSRRDHPVCSTLSPVSLSYRNVEELMAERNLSVDHVTIWRWVQRYAPELERRCRRELRMTNGSCRLDETYCRVAGKWTYL